MSEQKRYGPTNRRTDPFIEILHATKKLDYLHEVGEPFLPFVDFCLGESQRNCRVVLSSLVSVNGIRALINGK